MTIGKSGPGSAAWNVPTTVSKATLRAWIEPPTRPPTLRPIAPMKSPTPAVCAGRQSALQMPVYLMEQVVDAHRRVESWHKVGNVVITL